MNESNRESMKRYNLPLGDRTPEHFSIEHPSFVESWLKQPMRHFGYPFYTALVNQWLLLTHGKDAPFHIDKWLWGQRGNDPESHRRRINRLLPLTGKNVLIAGCGTARDVPSWLVHRPASLVGVDYFSYEKAWQMRLKYFHQHFPRTKVSFVQAELSHLDEFEDEHFDVIGSDAVFEHLNNLPSVLREFWRLLKPGGILYASFGPLWNCWGGDHISGYDSFAGGYNHLLLDQGEYKTYVARSGQFVHSELDGRTWIEHDMFSHLRPSEYLDLLTKKGFESIFTCAALDPRAVRYLRLYPVQKERLLGLTPHRMDLLVTAMALIFRKPNNDHPLDNKIPN